MPFTPTGRYQKDVPRFQSLPFSHSAIAYLRQARAAEVRAEQEAELDAIEHRAWAMFGITVDYCMDERIIVTGSK